MAKGRRISRRRFIARTAGAALGAISFPYIVPSSVLGQAGGVAHWGMGVDYTGPHEIHLYDSPGHHRDFLNCVKSRKTTITPCEVAHRSATPGHLGQIAMLLGRKIRFNPDTEEILDDPTAASLLGKAMRSPWHL